jgi:ketosteroid isomerase-like protein
MLPSDLLPLIEDYHRSSDAFTKGDPEPLKSLYSRRDDVTIANPFGPAAHGWQKASETITRAATHYRDGEALGFDRIADSASADLAFMHEVEWLRSKIGGTDQLVPVSLRVTTVFRREDSRWRVIHRHADPITAPRAAASIVAG